MEYNSIKSINRFLEKNRLWPILVLIIALSYAFIQINRTLTIGQYITTIFILFILMCPLVIVQASGFSKEDFKNEFLFYAFYLLIYLLFPLLIVLLKIDQYLFSHYIPGNISNHHSEIFPSFYLIVVIFQISLYKLPKLFNVQQKWSWLMQLNSFKVYAFLLFIFSLFIPFMSVEFEIKMESYTLGARIFHYLLVVLQFVLIYLAYYFVYYIHHHVLFNFLLKKKGILFYITGILAVFFILTPMINMYAKIFPITEDLKLHTSGFAEYILSDVNSTFTIMTLVISLPFILLIEWNKQTLSIHQLQQDKVSTELNLLKQQINPHFFFNTLNNLYSMSLTQEKSTPETIIKLSELMRYVIYKGKEDLVYLKDDLKYIQDYIDLQKIRIHKKLDYQCTISDYDESIKVPPLLFIIFVENAFKHGIEPAEHDCFLHLNLSISDHQLRFHCSNSTEATSETNRGIGLENLQKRLDLLYNDNYQLILDNQEAIYNATLIIDL